MRLGFWLGTVISEWYEITSENGEIEGKVEKIETILARSKSFIWLYLLDLRGLAKVNGGETGIRTLDTLRYTRFPSVRLQPLGHLSAVAPDLLNLPYLRASLLLRSLGCDLLFYIRA